MSPLLETDPFEIYSLDGNLNALIDQCSLARP